MRVVDKKIIPIYFKAVEHGDKRFELRKDEDDLQVGDHLCLHEWNGDYTGHKVNKEIKYVPRNVPELGLMKGYCIVGW